MSDEPSTGPAPSRKRWQFSLRGLLLFTAVFGAVLSVAVQLPGPFKVVLIVSSITCFVVAALWTANFVTSDRRPLLAAISWTVFGTFFLAYTAFSCYATILAAFAVSNGKSGASVLGPVLAGITIVMAVCVVVCFYRAGRAVVLSWRARRAGSAKTDSP